MDRLVQAIRYMKAHISTRVVLLGFELDLYATGELKSIYWYLDIVASSAAACLSELGRQDASLVENQQEAQVVASMALASLLMLVSRDSRPAQRKG
jgi:hypothetical protein